jgi:hypothetical protein
MKPSKLFLIAITASSIIASSAIARPNGAGTAPTARTSVSTVRASANHSRNHNWRHHNPRNHNWRHHRHHRSRVFFNVGYGYPFGYGYPYYGHYPYGYRYYAGPREAIYQAATSNRALAIEVQRRLARAGYYRGAIDGVIGSGTRNAIRSYERAHGLRVDGLLDQRLLATMGLS